MEIPFSYRLRTLVQDLFGEGLFSWSTVYEFSSHFYLLMNKLIVF